MPIRLKKYPRRLPRRKIVRRRRLPLVRVPGRPAQPTQMFKRTTYTTNWIVNSTLTNTFKNITFSLADVPNNTEFTNLYDQYCIKAVSLCLIPKFNVNTMTDIVPPVWSVLDYDGTFPATQDAMLQYNNLHMTRGQGWIKRYFKPRVLQQIYQAGLTNANSPKRSQFIDCQNINVPHYGATIMLLPGNFGGDSPFAYDLKVTYYLAFRNQR